MRRARPLEPTAPEVHVQIRRLSIDAGVAGAAALDAADFQTALESALAGRLGGHATTLAPTRDGSSSITQSVADAVAANVRPSVTHARGWTGGDRG